MCEHNTNNTFHRRSETLRRRRLTAAPWEHDGLLSESTFRAVYLCKLQKNTFEQGHKKVHSPNPHCNPSTGKVCFYINFKIYSLNNPLQSPNLLLFKHFYVPLLLCSPSVSPRPHCSSSFRVDVVMGVVCQTLRLCSIIPCDLPTSVRS